MPVNNGIITGPINYEDPYKCMGVGKYNGSYDLIYICSNRHRKTNGWSKKKPVIRRGIEASIIDPNWYKADDGFCGFSVGWAQSQDSSLTNLINAYKEGTWIYKPPTGGDDAPYRILDFEGYDHNAVPFISSKKAKGETYEVNVMDSNALTLFVYYNDSPTSLQIEDFDTAAVGLSTAHLAAALYNGNPLESNTVTRLRTVISDVPINNRGTVTFTFDENDIATSRYVMFFLASTTVSNNICIPYDDDNYFLFKINIKQEFLLRITPTAMGVVNNIQSISYWGSNNFPSNNGYADVIFFFSMKNTGSKAITVGSATSTDYALRAKFDSIYTTALTRCDVDGNALSDNITINAGQTFTGYYKAPRMFLEFVNSWASSTSSLRGQLTIEAYNKKGGAVSAWQTVSSSYMIYVKR